MFNKIPFYSLLISTLVLSGCATPPGGGLDLNLAEPRPTSTDSSYAMKVATAIQTTARCLGCKDTILWQNEKSLANTASFYAKRVSLEEYKLASDYRQTIRELHKSGKLTKESLPPPPKVVLNEQNYQSTQDKSGGLSNSLMLADSFDGKWTNPGSSLGAGLALGLLLSSSAPENDENKMFPPANYMKAAIVLPNKIPFEQFNHKQLSTEEKAKENASAYGAIEFVRLMTKSAVDMGYKPIDDVRFVVNKFAEKPYWEIVYQPLENDDIGCPKVLPNSDRKDICRIEFGNYTMYNIRHPYTHFYEKNIVPTIFGGNGKTTRWMAHMGYHRNHPFGLIVDKARNLTSKDGDRNYRHAMGMQKHLKAGQFIYVPAYFLSNGQKTPQCVLDNKGVHYFSVVVPENRPVQVKPVVANPEKEQTFGMSDLLNKVTNL